MVAEVHSLEKLKALKKIKKDLELLIPTIDTIIKSFSLYKNYVPVSNILNCLENERSILKIHFEKLKNDLKEKGKLNGEK